MKRKSAVENVLDTEYSTKAAAAAEQRGQVRAPEAKTPNLQTERRDHAAWAAQQRQIAEQRKLGRVELYERLTGLGVKVSSIHGGKQKKKGGGTS